MKEKFKNGRQGTTQSRVFTFESVDVVAIIFKTVYRYSYKRYVRIRQAYSFTDFFPD